MAHRRVRCQIASECAINPVAPALANAVKNDTGVRCCDIHLMPHDIFDRLMPVQERR